MADVHIGSPHFTLEHRAALAILRLCSPDGTNRLTRSCVQALTIAISQLREEAPVGGLVLTGNQKFFSAGADLQEITVLTGPAAYEFSLIGQALMNTVDDFPAPVFAAVNGYCMGGGFDLALACDHRIAGPHAIFGHRGAALGLITGWGGTQRLSRLIGKSRALEMFVAAEKLNASHALRIGLVDCIAPDPVEEAIRRLNSSGSNKFSVSL